MTIELYARELPLSKHAIWQEAHNFYLVVILLLTTTLVVPYLSFGTKVPQKAARSVLFATLFPLAALLFFREPIGGKLFQIHMYAFTFSSIVLGAYLFKTSLGNLPLITRDHAVENMNEGWVLLDTKNRIVDVNPSAERILYTSKAKVYGKDAKVIFARWPNIAKSLEAQQEFDGKGSLSIEGRIRYLHVRIFRIQDNEESVSGRLILLRDHTDRRQADAARQDARDEMFSLLHSISGAASRS
jgi:PAS domain S-box-containing protein